MYLLFDIEVIPVQDVPWSRAGQFSLSPAFTR
jgi:hypothetical protein